MQTLHISRIRCSVAISFPIIISHHIPSFSPLCSHGHGLVRGIHCICTTTQLKGINVTADRTAIVRRVLGILLVVHIQHECYGEGGHTTGRQSGRHGGAQTEFGRIRPGHTETESARQTGVPQLPQYRPFLDAGPRRHRHARFAVVLCIALRCVQEVAGHIGRCRCARAKGHELQTDLFPLLSAGVSTNRFMKHGDFLIHDNN